MSERNVTPNPERFRLFRLCECTSCGGNGKVHGIKPGESYATPPRCNDCRGEGRVRQEVATCESPEAVGVALVTLAREGEWDECPFGLLDQTPDCPTCTGAETGLPLMVNECPECKGTGVKPTGTWLIRPWLPSARNVTDAARTLAKSKTTSRQT
jgi:DnaJ-class molecular chaperone